MEGRGTCVAGARGGLDLLPSHDARDPRLCGAAGPSEQNVLAAGVRLGVVQMTHLQSGLRALAPRLRSFCERDSDTRLIQGAVSPGDSGGRFTGSTPIRFLSRHLRSLHARNFRVSLENALGSFFF